MNREERDNALIKQERESKKRKILLRVILKTQYKLFINLIFLYKQINFIKNLISIHWQFNFFFIQTSNQISPCTYLCKYFRKYKF